MDPVGVDYDTRNVYHTDDLRAVVDRAEIQPDDTILDLGCGTGTLISMMAKETNARVYGVDRDPRQLNHARTKVAAVDAERIHYVEGDIQTMTHKGKPISFPGLDRGFDLVTMTWVWHHLTDAERRRIAESVRPLLAPGARIAVDLCYSGSSVDPISSGMTFWDVETHDVFLGLQWVHPDHVRRSNEALRRLAATLGWQMHRPIQLHLGDGRYMDAATQIPPLIEENMTTLREAIGPISHLASLRLSEKDRSYIVRFCVMYAMIKSGRCTNVGDYVKRFIHPKHTGDGDDKNMTSGSKWHRDVLPMYDSVINTLRRVQGKDPDKVVRTNVCAKQYQSSGVFKYPDPSEPGE